VRGVNIDGILAKAQGKEKEEDFDNGSVAGVCEKAEHASLDS
jgi:hypothetical protein